MAAILRQSYNTTAILGAPYQVAIPVTPAWPEGAALSATNKTDTTVTLTASSDAADAVGYEWSSDDGGTYPFTSLTRSFTFSALTPNTSYSFRERAYSADGKRSAHLALTTSTYRAGATGQWILDRPGSFMSQCIEVGDEGAWFDWELVTPAATGAWVDGPYADGTGVFSGPAATSMVILLRKNGVSVGNFTVTLYDSTVFATQAGGWEVRNLVAATQAGGWEVLAPVPGATTVVSTTQAGAWSVRNLVAATQAGAWSVRNLVAATQAGAWSVSNTARTISSELRIVRVDSDGSGILGKFTMQPGEVLDYCFDFQPWLNDCGDSILAFPVTATDDLPVLETEQVGGAIVALVQGTVDGATHKLTSTIHTAGGRIKAAEITIRIKEV